MANLCCKRNFKDLIKLRYLRWGDYPGSSDKALNVIMTNVLTRGRQEETEWKMLHCFEDGL